MRGWNDPGCRISVRFADNAEQRELRVGVFAFRSTNLTQKKVYYSVLKGH